jgi:virulence-associated protein VapD
MYALAFDLDMKALVANYPGANANNAYGAIKQTLTARGFRWTQGSLYLLDNEDMSVLFQAIQDLMQITWFPRSVRDIRAFRVEQWSDFTAMVKGFAPGPGKSVGTTGQLFAVPKKP